MHEDERKIREVVERWLAETRKGNVAAVAKMMADDVVFMVPGQEPFGKDQFIANGEKMRDFAVDATSDIREIQVLGGWAWMRNRLSVKITPPTGESMIHAGYTLTILRKQPDGSWVIARDANLLMPQQ